MAQQFLGLSLFVILLCFFIVLTSMSDYKEVKSIPVLQSLEMAFAGRASGHEQNPSPRQLDADQAQEGDALDKIKALFTAQIKAFKAHKNRLGTEMRLRLPLAEFEKLLADAAAVGIDQRNVLKGKGGAFLPTLVSLTDSGEAGPSYKMDIMVEIPENPANLQNDRPAEMAEWLRKTAGFADTLERAGMPKKRIGAGLAQAREGGDPAVRTVELIFTRYEPVDPTGGRSLRELGGKGEASDG